jgi:MOSC domain-containing protein YiiM
MSGKILDIFISPTIEEPMTSVDSAELVAGKGIVGDRYFDEQGTWSKIYPWPDRHISIINMSVIDAFKNTYGIDLTPIDLRRNVLVDVPFFKPFMAHKFFLGNTVLCTSRYSYPCKTLQDRLGKKGLIKICKQEVWCFGIHCQILKGGTIHRGDRMRLPETNEDRQLLNSSLVNKPERFTDDGLNKTWLN